MEKTITALVVAGGTREPIDAVRFITNSSGGRLGHLLQVELELQGVNVHMLASKQMARLYRLPKSTRTFDSFLDLQRELALAAKEIKPDIVFMAAAVADYSPVKAEGKIPSDADTLVIVLKKNPKLIGSFRQQFGIQSFLVGFKLLSKVTQLELHNAAFGLVKSNRLNLVVANDLSLINNESHPIRMVTPEGGSIPVDGDPKLMVKRLVSFVLRRFYVSWHKSTPTLSRCQHHPQKPPQKAKVLLDFAKDASLLPNTSGNVSARDLQYVWTSPRGVVKAKVQFQDLILTRTNMAERIVEYAGNVKPSIDSAVLARILNAFPGVDMILHTHYGLFASDATTSFPFPCGTVEEANEIIRVANKAGKVNSFSIEMIDHGYLLALQAQDVDELKRSWSIAVSRYQDHMVMIGETRLADAIKANDTSNVLLQPIFRGVTIVGVHATLSAYHASTPFLFPENRGAGLGRVIIRSLQKQGVNIVTHERCEILDLYLKMGWSLIGTHDAFTVLRPPSF